MSEQANGETVLKGTCHHVHHHLTPKLVHRIARNVLGVVQVRSQYHCAHLYTVNTTVHMSTVSTTVYLSTVSTTVYLSTATTIISNSPGEIYQLLRTNQDAK